ncbi:hypothetical protein EIP91_003191 [Steccherinum ochraceum]|uniref:Uncharacterized protein n=1 Tax=Steccherinum ochraceum TaxID=92696 RepID=A0A4R0S2L5_9APHY|nr:hypothetical protein EIP91_003191 [Steccherinum ochraceum]
MTRFIHHTNVTQTSAPDAYKQGQDQAQLSIVRYHYLRAAATRAFASTNEGRRFVLFAREDLQFSKYKDYKLENVQSIKIHVPSPDGRTRFEEIRPYVELFQHDSYQCREGGILYCVAEWREFWNIIMHFHCSPQHTTGIGKWDDILVKLQSGEAGQEIVPCMVSTYVLTNREYSLRFRKDRDALFKLQPSLYQQFRNGSELAEIERIDENCQKKDWKRHKKEPCLPYVEMVDNDKLWNMFGTRKGTGDSQVIIVDER